MANPSFLSVTYLSAPSSGGADSLTLWWNADGGTSFTVLIADTTAGTSMSYDDLTGFMTSLSPGLNANDSYTVQIACTDGGTTGSYSAPVPILTVAPSMTRLQNQTSSLSVAWDAVAGTSVTYSITFQLGSTSTTMTTSDTSVVYAVQQAMTGDDNTVGLQVTETVVNGSASTVVNGPSCSYQVITDTTSLTQLDNSDSAELVVGWAAASGAAAYEATLAGSDGSSQAQPATGTSTSFAGPFTAGITYTATASVTSADGVSVGPASPAVAAVTTAPTLVSVVNSGGGVTLTWNQLAGCSYYQASLIAPDGTASVQYGFGPALTFSGSLSQTGYTCTVAGTTSDMVVLGPATAPVNVVVGSPLWVLVANDGTSLDLSWTAVTDPAVSGYQIVISGLMPTSTFSSAGTGTSCTLVGSLTPMTSYPTTVCATDGISAGPSSPALIPLTAAPMAAMLGYTGSALQMSWQPSGESGVTGYQVTLTVDGTAESPVSTTASPTIVSGSFEEATVYSGAVRASGAGTLGPSATVPGPYKSTRTYTFDALGRIATIAWQDAFTETYTFDSAGNALGASYVATPAPAANGD